MNTPIDGAGSRGAANRNGGEVSGASRRSGGFGDQTISVGYSHRSQDLGDENFGVGARVVGRYVGCVDVAGEGVGLWGIDSAGVGGVSRGGRFDENILSTESRAAGRGVRYAATERVGSWGVVNRDGEGGNGTSRRGSGLGDKIIVTGGGASRRR